MRDHTEITLVGVMRNDDDLQTILSGIKMSAHNTQIKCFLEITSDNATVIS